MCTKVDRQWLEIYKEQTKDDEKVKTTSRTEKICFAFELAPRCGARTKGNHGLPCRCPAIKGKKRCRVHGGKGSGAKLSNNNAWKDGNYSTEAKEFRKKVKQVICWSNKLLMLINNK